MWSMALEYYLKLNSLFSSWFHRDILDYEKDILLLKNRLYGYDGEEVIEWDKYDIDVTRTLDNMSDDDLVFFSTLMLNSQRDNVLLFKYDNIAIWNNTLVNPNDEFNIYGKLLRNFRGIVLDIKDKAIICSPFDKFANVDEYGWEENAFDKIVEEFNNAKVIEESNKLDGSLQSARWYKDKIVLTGSGCVDISKSPSLAEGCEWILKQESYKKMLMENADDTHIFEWISLADAHIVSYSKEDTGLYLIGIRNTLTGKQYSYNEVISRANKYGVKTTELYTKTLNELIEDCKLYKAQEKEGFVVNLDGHFVKIKCDDYVSIARILKTASSFNEIIRAIYYDTIDDILAKLPHTNADFILNKANYVRYYYNSFKDKVVEYYNIAPKDDRKTFMVWVQKNVPKMFFGEVVNIYLNKQDNILGYVMTNKCGEKVEHFIKFHEIENRMNVLGKESYLEYITN